MNSKRFNGLSRYAIYLKPVVLGMVVLGFSAGLPYQLIFFTFALWLRDTGVDYTTIGFLSWIGIIYALKVFVSLIVDRFSLPFLTHWLGKRRSWIIITQFLIVVCLIGMSNCNPKTELSQLTFLAIAIIFSSAIQDVVVDAYRIEVVSASRQGTMSAAYVIGYRMALLASGAGALYIAEYSSWQTAYLSMACSMLVGIIAIFLMKEPEHHVAKETYQIKKIVFDPFIEFFQRKGRWGFIILLFVSLYKMSDISLGTMSGAFYIDLGFTKSEIANVTKVFSFFAAIAGATFGGILIAHYNEVKPIIFATITASATNLLFIILSVSKPTLTWLAIVVTADSFFASMATTILIAYLASLTGEEHTASQYGLFSSLMTLPSQTIGGFSGMIVESYGYSLFFAYSTLIGLPAVLLAIVVNNREKIKDSQKWREARIDFGRQTILSNKV